MGVSDSYMSIPEYSYRTRTYLPRPRDLRARDQWAGADVIVLGGGIASVPLCGVSRSPASDIGQRTARRRSHPYAGRRRASASLPRSAARLPAANEPNREGGREKLSAGAKQLPRCKRIG